MKRYAVIVAGGQGLRMGGDLPKQFIPVQGKPLLMHTLAVFHQWDRALELIVVLPEEHHAYWQMLCREIGCQIPHQIVNGGATRFQSVKNGLQKITEEGLVAVHDGVRPFVSPAVISACFEKASVAGGAIPVIPVVESIRQKTEAGSAAVDRSRFFAVQTPQVFQTKLLMEAYDCAEQLAFTDDASVFEAAGRTVELVPGNRENIKVTTPLDLIIAESLVANHSQ